MGTQMNGRFPNGGTGAEIGVGGARRDRTADLLHAMQALSQLSYSPTREARSLPTGPGVVKAPQPDPRTPDAACGERLFESHDRVAGRRPWMTRRGPEAARFFRI